MTPVAATTFLHEVGHCVHSLLSRTQFQHLSGTRGAVDFVELPSHLFEYYVLDPDALMAYMKCGGVLTPRPGGTAAECPRGREQVFEAIKNLTQDARLESAIRDFRAHRNLFAHTEAAQQLQFALVDQAFYAAPPGTNAAELHRLISEVGSADTELAHNLGLSVDCNGEFVDKRNGNNSVSTLRQLLSPGIIYIEFKGLKKRHLTSP